MILLALACSTPDRPEPGSHRPATVEDVEVEVGARAADFVLEGHDGAPIRLSDHEGQVIVLDLSGFD